MGLVLPHYYSSIDFFSFLVKNKNQFKLTFETKQIIISLFQLFLLFTFLPFLQKFALNEVEGVITHICISNFVQKEIILYEEKNKYAFRNFCMSGTVNELKGFILPAHIKDKGNIDRSLPQRK